ncbi:MAG: hypothetical protein Q4D78_08165 [Neisseria zoodegmatis]|uniref:hypothetical protein n=1 Tax=Neisseria zoodegmatis TaxID=326523 RepID=UPI0026F0B99A|nr:hypothetical protein [Neisseria zoodegmatis]MDO5070147.1 hypothetical protein [Neisseria zoodegmatis]
MNPYVCHNETINRIITPINFLEEGALKAKELSCPLDIDYYWQIDDDLINKIRNEPVIVDFSGVSAYPELSKFGVYELPENIIEIRNIEQIYQLKQLRSLVIMDKKMAAIDLAQLPQLEILTCDPCDPKHIINIDKAHNLKAAKLWSYKGKDLTEFSKLEKLESLELMNPSIYSLKGIEHMRALKDITLLGTRKLEDVSLLEKSLDKLPNLTRVDLPKKFEAQMQAINERLRERLA